jgi:hypothetical protein
MPRQVLFRGRLLALPERRRRRGRVVEWRLTRGTWYRYQEFLAVWEQYPDASPERSAIEDDIRALPGFPRGYDVETDEIQPVITDQIH